MLEKIESVLNKNGLEKYFDYCQFGENRINLTNDSYKHGIDIKIDAENNIFIVIAKDIPRLKEGVEVYCKQFDWDGLKTFISEYVKYRHDDKELEDYIVNTINNSKFLHQIFTMWTP